MCRAPREARIEAAREGALAGVVRPVVGCGVHAVPVPAAVVAGLGVAVVSVAPAPVTAVVAIAEGVVAVVTVRLAVTMPAGHPHAFVPAQRAGDGFE